MRHWHFYFISTSKVMQTVNSSLVILDFYIHTQKFGIIYTRHITHHCTARYIYICHMMFYVLMNTYRILLLWYDICYIYRMFFVEVNRGWTDLKSSYLSHQHLQFWGPQRESQSRPCASHVGRTPMTLGPVMLVTVAVSTIWFQLGPGSHPQTYHKSTIAHIALEINRCH